MLNAYAIHDFILKRWVSYDKYNNPTYQNEPVKGYIEWKNVRVRDIEGEEVVAAATIWLPNRYAKPDHKDIVEVDGVDHTIINATDLTDFSNTGWTFYIN